MRLSRWEPLGGMFNQVNHLQKEVNRLFDRWGGDGWNLMNGNTQFPPLNVWEDAEHVSVDCELPGLDLKDLEIYVTGGNQLTIKGERKQQLSENAVFHRQERTFGTFVRVLTLPFPVNSDKVEAKLEHGVLTIKLAKHEAAKPRKIAIKAE
ncbi:MAG: Hsp20/alpha crystallin family protein [Gemmataceae bacterium]|nr:Hsp20/alpha crystallin family protein [Gemmataceae bacterium]